MIITSSQFFSPVTRCLSNKKAYLGILLSLFLPACAKMNLNVSNGMVLPANTPILIGPMANHSDTPLANRQVEAMSLGILQTKGFRNLVPFPRPQSCDKLLYCPDEGITNARLIQWARRHHVTFVLTGAANEWRYKVGLDGEPAAGVTLVLLNAQTGKTVWTAVGSAIGGSRYGLNVIGQRLLTALFANFATRGGMVGSAGQVRPVAMAPARVAVVAPSKTAVGKPVKVALGGPVK